MSVPPATLIKLRRSMDNPRKEPAPNLPESVYFQKPHPTSMKSTGVVEEVLS